ncbi:hypothetical protein J6590_046462 [Homalodisca vitripennis]|nr:hypothetical protein J6590_046462 [Homalodisca vitripennis]
MEDGIPYECHHVIHKTDSSRLKPSSNIMLTVTVLPNSVIEIKLGVSVLKDRGLSFFLNQSSWIWIHEPVCRSRTRTVPLHHQLPGDATLRGAVAVTLEEPVKVQRGEPYIVATLYHLSTLSASINGRDELRSSHLTAGVRIVSAWYPSEGDLAGNVTRCPVSFDTLGTALHVSPQFMVSLSFQAQVHRWGDQLEYLIIFLHPCTGILLVCLSVGLTLAEEKVAEKKHEKRGLFDLGYGYPGYAFAHSAVPAPLPVYHAHPAPPPPPPPHPLNAVSHVHTTVTKHVPVPVPAPYPVTVEKQVPVPVPAPYPVHVPKPYPVVVDRPYPVPVEKPVHVPVDRPVPYPVPQPVAVPVAHPVHVPVPQPYPVVKHVPVPVAHPVPVPVHAPHPAPAHLPVHGHPW